MKKKYLKPEMKVYEVETPQLLTGSPDLKNGVAPEDENEDIL